MRTYAEALTAEVLRDGGFVAPPVDLLMLADRLGVDDIRLESCREEGSVRRDGSSTIVVLRKDRSRQRQRFTLAHELAHLMLAQGDALETSFRMPSERSTTLEGLCDDIAASLLMPSTWVKAHVSGRPFSLATVRRLASSCDVSLAASLVRLNEIAGWRGVLLRWAYRRQRYRLMSCTGAPPEIRAQVASAPSTESVLQTSEIDVDRWTHLPIAVGRAVLSVRAELNCRADTAVALTDYRQLRFSGS
jgi:Zn-dependent peptidase ImmA (M78 family)